LNLIKNGADAFGSGGGALQVALDCDGDSVIVTIADNGPGISDDVLAQIFDPFFTTKGVGKGTGLGLSVSHGTVEAHGGVIEVDSVVGEGTEFRIYLPIAGTDANEQRSGE
jgi:two-component system NtrC family sensor kinase